MCVCVYVCECGRECARADGLIRPEHTWTRWCAKTTVQRSFSELFKTLVSLQQDVEPAKLRQPCLKRRPALADATRLPAESTDLSPTTETEVRAREQPGQVPSSLDFFLCKLHAVLIDCSRRAFSPDSPPRQQALIRAWHTFHRCPSHLSPPLLARTRSLASSSVSGVVIMASCESDFIVRGLQRGEKYFTPGKKQTHTRSGRCVFVACFRHQYAVRMYEHARNLRSSTFPLLLL